MLVLKRTILLLLIMLKSLHAYQEVAGKSMARTAAGRQVRRRFRGGRGLRGGQGNGRGGGGCCHGRDIGSGGGRGGRMKKNGRGGDKSGMGMGRGGGGMDLRHGGMHGSGMGIKSGGMGMGMGMGGEEHRTIHNMMWNRHAIDREVNDTSDGVVTTTTSDDPEVADWIVQHVQQMKSRLETGMPVRRWDPLFEAVFNHHHQINMDFKLLTKENEDVLGVEVEESGDDRFATALVQAHAQAVSGFLSKGHEAMHSPHPVPTVDEEEQVDMKAKAEDINSAAAAEMIEEESED